MKAFVAMMFQMSTEVEYSECPSSEESSDDDEMTRALRSEQQDIMEDVSGDKEGNFEMEIDNEESDLYELLKDFTPEDLPDMAADMDIQSFFMGLNANNVDASRETITAFADIIHQLSVTIKENGHKANASENMASSLEYLNFSQYHPPSQLVRHPPPASGRDDSIEKLREVLDDVLWKSGHRGDLGDRVLFAPDHKIGVNLLRLKRTNAKYDSVIPEFPVLHLRKSKITNLCSAYKDLGMLHLLMYMRDTDDQEWAKLIESAHIDQATRYIRRLALALHMAFMVSFMGSISGVHRIKLMHNLASGSVEDSISDEFDSQYRAFIHEGKKNNVIFALHHEIMEHCDEVVGLAFAERLGGNDGYNLLLAIVKRALPFAFLNGSSSYALFSTQLLHQHYKCGPFCKNLKASLFTSPHKESDLNFGLDTQREMDHQDVSRSFRSSATLSSVIPKMSNVDFLVQELQSIVRQEQLIDRDQDEGSARSQSDLLSINLSTNDQSYIYRAAAMILRQGGISHVVDTKLRNIYDKNDKVFSSALLDRESLDVGTFLIKKCIAKEQLFGCVPSSKPEIGDFIGPSSLLKRAAATKSTTIKRTSTKLEKEKKSSNDLQEERRIRKVNRDKKRVESLGARMNACQAIVQPDGSKSSVSKAEGIKKATKYLLIDAYRMIHSMPHSDYNDNILKTLKDDRVLIEKGEISDIDPEKIGILTIEFAGVKFKRDHTSGDDYLKYVEKEIIQKFSNLLPNSHHIAISEEKYSFTPDTFKAPTRKQRSEKHSISVHHLKQPDEIISPNTFSKPAITKTKEGKSTISTYLAKHINMVNPGRKVTIDVDSELHMSTCTCSSETCLCQKYAIPLRGIFGTDGRFESCELMDVQQCKGEAELAQVDWLIHYIPTLQPGETCLSIVLSGDIDALVVHMLALSHLWPLNDNGDFLADVYVMLIKPYSKDIYNVTGIIRLLEKAYGEDHIAMKIAVFLCVGGNDFIPNYYLISHKDIIEKIMSNATFRSNLVELTFNGTVCTSVLVNHAVFLDLVKSLYCPKNLDCEAFTFDEIRQISVKVPRKKKQQDECRNPRQWLPPASAIAQISKLVQHQCQYMLTAGFSDASLPDVTECFNVNGSDVQYNLGPDAHVASSTDILKASPEILFMKMSIHRVKTKKKRSATETPQKGSRKKIRPKMSTPKKITFNL